MPNIPGLLMGVATTLAVLATAPHVVLTQGVMKGDDAAITTTTKSPSYHYSHYYYHPDARHAAAAAEDRPPPPKRNIVSNDSVGGGCPRDGAAERALMDACPDISRLIDSGMMMSAVRGDNQTARSVLMKDIEQLMFASPDAITAICRPINCLDAIRASPCIASTNNNGTIALAEAVCGCHAALDAACQASFREAAVLLPMSEVVLASFAQTTIEHHHHHQQPSHHNTSNVVLTDSAVMDDSAVAAVATVDELETTPLGAAVVMPASDDALMAVEEPSRRHISCVMPLHCRTILAEAEECATVAPLFLTDTYMEAAHYCCNNNSDGDYTTTDSDDCSVDSVVSNGSNNSSVAGGRNSSSSASSAVRRRQYYNNNNRDAENEMLAMVMPDSIMALVEVFLDPPRTSLVNGYLPPLARRVDKLREASIYGVGDAVTLPMRDICEWVSRSRDAESGAEGLFWDMLARPGNITEVCRKVQSNGECLQTAVDVCFGGSTEDFIALVDAALTEELIAQEYYKAYYYSYNYDGYDEWAAQNKERIQEMYRRGEGWDIFELYRVDWRTDAVLTVEILLHNILYGAIYAYEEYSDYGEGMYGGVQGLLNRVIGPLCTPACESLISSCEAVSPLTRLFHFDYYFFTESGDELRNGMCRDVEPPLLSFGAEKRLVRVEATLSGLATVEDFTNALRSKFRQDMAKAANVPLSLVRIMDVRAGISVVVVTEVLIRADTDGAVEAHVNGFKAALDDPTGIFESRYFGTVSWTVFGSSDPDESGVDTVFGSPAFAMVLSLMIVVSLILVA